MGKDYLITEHSYRRAKELGVELKPAENKHKKIDVFKNGEYMATIGSKNYKDYGTYLEMEARGEVPKGYSADRRRLYKQRHKYDKGISGFLANRILW
jgi:hypothetical protein